MSMNKLEKMKKFEKLSLKMMVEEEIKFEIYYGLRKAEDETEEEYVVRRNDRIVQEYKINEKLIGFNKVDIVWHLAKKFSLDVAEIEDIVG